MFENRKFSVSMLLCVLCTAVPAFGLITGSGDVSPAPMPGVGMLEIGITGDGQVSVTDGSQIAGSLKSCTLGLWAGSNGTLNVSGDGSLISTLEFIVGNEGAGTLNISDGAVASGMNTYIGYRGGSGRVNLDGGTLQATTLYAAIGGQSSASTFTGTGTIDVSGFAGNLDLVFDNPADVSQSFTFTSADSSLIDNIQLNISGNYGTIGGGYNGDGSVTISNGVHLNSAYGLLGMTAGDTGTALVTGENTHWELNGHMELACGDNSSGHLAVTHGARITAGSLYACYGDNAGASIKVDGHGSEIDIFDMVMRGNSLLEISNGATVDINAVLILDGDGPNTVNITGNGSLLKLGRENNVYLGGRMLHMTGDDVINMSSGAMLALFGDVDADLSEFLALTGSDIDDGEIRYFNAATGQWASLTGATEGEDYTLVYHEDGEFAGHTVLTVMAVPEPATLAMMALGTAVVAFRRRHLS